MINHSTTPNHFEF